VNCALIEALGVPVMSQAIEAYRHVSASEQFKEIERLRFLARYNEGSALAHAAEVEREKWDSHVLIGMVVLPP